jgi:HSP20 family protein
MDRLICQLLSADYAIMSVDCAKNPPFIRVFCIGTPFEFSTWNISSVNNHKIYKTMTLVKLNNRSLPRTFDSVFNDFFHGVAGGLGDALQTVPVNVHETKDAYHLELSAPGLNKEDFAINVEKDLLTISYEKKEESKSDDFKTLRREFSYRSFKRSFTLQDDVNVENIQAKYENGVLKLYLPKTEPAQSGNRQISIQ